MARRSRRVELTKIVAVAALESFCPTIGTAGAQTVLWGKSTLSRVAARLPLAHGTGRQNSARHQSRERFAPISAPTARSATTQENSFAETPACTPTAHYDCHSAHLAKDGAFEKTHLPGGHGGIVGQSRSAAPARADIQKAAHATNIAIFSLAIEISWKNDAGSRESRNRVTSRRGLGKLSEFAGAPVQRRI